MVRKTDTRRIKHYVLSRVAGRTIRTDDDFLIWYTITDETEREDLWDDIEDVVEEIIAQSRGRISNESIEEVLEGIRDVITELLEAEDLHGLVPKNNELFEEKLYRLIGWREE